MALTGSRFIGGALLSGLIISVAVASGVYFGFSQSLSKSRALSPDLLRNDSYLEIGDTLSLSELEVKSGSRSTTLAEIIGDNRAIVVFLSHDCGACEAMVRHWNRHLVPLLPQDMRLVCVYDDDDNDPQRDTWDAEGSLKRAILVFASNSRFQGTTGIHATPTTIGVVAGGRIAFVMTGLDKRVNLEFLERVL